MMGSMRCFAGVAWSRVNCERVEIMVGERIWSTRDWAGSSWSVEKMSSSWVGGERIESREERISKYAEI